MPIILLEASDKNEGEKLWKHKNEPKVQSCNKSILKTFPERKSVLENELYN